MGRLNVPSQQDVLLTFDCDGLGVLQDGVCRGHLNRHGVHSLGGEGVRDATVKGHQRLEAIQNSFGSDSCSRGSTLLYGVTLIYSLVY